MVKPFFEMVPALGFVRGLTGLSHRLHGLSVWRSDFVVEQIKGLIEENLSSEGVLFFDSQRGSFSFLFSGRVSFSGGDLVGIEGEVLSGAVELRLLFEDLQVLPVIVNVGHKKEAEFPSVVWRANWIKSLFQSGRITTELIFSLWFWSIQRGAVVFNSELAGRWSLLEERFREILKTQARGKRRGRRKVWLKVRADKGSGRTKPMFRGEDALTTGWKDNFDLSPLREWFCGYLGELLKGWENFRQARPPQLFGEWESLRKRMGRVFPDWLGYYNELVGRRRIKIWENGGYILSWSERKGLKLKERAFLEEKGFCLPIAGVLVSPFKKARDEEGWEEEIGDAEGELSRAIWKSFEFKPVLADYLGFKTVKKNQELFESFLNLFARETDLFFQCPIVIEPKFDEEDDYRLFVLLISLWETRAGKRVSDESWLREKARAIEGCSLLSKTQKEILKILTQNNLAFSAKSFVEKEPYRTLFRRLLSVPYLAWEEFSFEDELFGNVVLNAFKGLSSQFWQEWFSLYTLDRKAHKDRTAERETSPLWNRFLSETFCGTGFSIEVPEESPFVEDYNKPRTIYDLLERLYKQYFKFLALKFETEEEKELFSVCFPSFKTFKPRAFEWFPSLWEKVRELAKKQTHVQDFIAQIRLKMGKPAEGERVYFIYEDLPEEVKHEINDSLARLLLAQLSANLRAHVARKLKEKGLFSKYNSAYQYTKRHFRPLCEDALKKKLGKGWEQLEKEGTFSEIFFTAIPTLIKHAVAFIKNPHVKTGKTTEEKVSI